MGRALTSIISNITSSDTDSEVIKILKKLRDYNANTKSYNLEKGDIIRTPDGTQRYEVQDVVTGLVESLEDNTSLNIDFKDMQKEKMDCNPTLWDIL